VGGGLIGHCVSPQPWREIDASDTKASKLRCLKSVTCIAIDMCLSSWTLSK